jgi:phosphate transport system permease protein
LATSELTLAGNDDAHDVRRPIPKDRATSDRVFRATSTVMGALVLLIMFLIGLFLFVHGFGVIHSEGLRFFTRSQWQPESGTFGVAAVLLGTLMIAVVALALAVPVAIGTALFLTDYAPAWLRRPMTSLVDLLAAIPSLVFGIWGFVVLQPREIKISRWLTTHLGFIPVFRTSGVNYASSTFIAGTVVGVMVVPIATAVMREVFSQAPPGEREAALALGGTKWGMIRSVVLPFGRGGIVGGTMLGLGRALGETIAVVLIISPSFDIHTLFRPLQSGGNSIAALIVEKFFEGSPAAHTALIGAGLILFFATLIVNVFASMIVSRSRSGSAVEI